MRISIGELRALIREEAKRAKSRVWNGDEPDKRLSDDDSMSKKSMLVPDDIKDQIRSYFKSMHL